MRTLSGSSAISILRQAVQAERHHSLPQFRYAADVAAFVKRSLTSSCSSWVSSRIVPRIEAVHWMPVACGAGCKARTRTDEGAILP